MNLKTPGRSDEGYWGDNCLDLPYILPNQAKIINYSRDIDAIHKPDVYIGIFIKSGSIKRYFSHDTLVTS